MSFFIFRALKKIKKNATRVFTFLRSVAEGNITIFFWPYWRSHNIILISVMCNIYLRQPKLDLIMWNHSQKAALAIIQCAHCVMIIPVDTRYRQEHTDAVKSIWGIGLWRTVARCRYFLNLGFAWNGSPVCVMCIWYFRGRSVATRRTSVHSVATRRTSLRVFIFTVL